MNIFQLHIPETEGSLHGFCSHVLDSQLRKCGRSDMYSRNLSFP